MKRIYVLRHSKAGHTNKKLLDDHERPLTDKGVDMCAVVADCLKEHDPLPELVLCSTALRAKQTASNVLENLGQNIETIHIHGLYLAEPDLILQAIHNVDESINSIMIVGHNPGLQQLSLLLSGKGDKKKFRAMRSNFPPPSLAVFDIDQEHWFDVAEQSAELVDFVAAKTVKKEKAA